MQSLLASMSPGQRRQLQDMMQSLFMQDERLEAELRQLGMNLAQLMPPPDGAAATTSAATTTSP